MAGSLARLLDAPAWRRPLLLAGEVCPRPGYLRYCFGAAPGPAALTRAQLRRWTRLVGELRIHLTGPGAEPPAQTGWEPTNVA